MVTELEILNRQGADIIMGYYILIFTISFVLNSLVLVVFLGSSHLHTTSNLILISMTASDWLMAVMAKSVGIYGNAMYWPTRSLALCDYYAFMTSVIGYSSIMHLTALTVERWLAVTRPMTTQISEKQMLCVIAGLWAFSTLWAAFPLVGWSSYGPEPGYASCSIEWFTEDASNKSYIICIFMFFFILPIAIMVACFGHIYYVVKTISDEAVARWGGDSQATRETFAAKKKTALMSFVMVFCFVFAWTPYAGVALWASFSGATSMNMFAGILPSLFAKLSNCYNPFIYFFLYTKFRRAARRFWIKNIVRPADDESSRVLSGVNSGFATSFPQRNAVQGHSNPAGPGGNVPGTVEDSEF